MGKAVATPRHSPLPHDHAIRSKLLNSLGIYKAVPVRNTGERRKHVIRSSFTSTSQAQIHQQRIRHAEQFRLPLNDNIDASNTSSTHQPLAFSSPLPVGAASISPPSSTSSLDPSNSSNDRSIHFENEVMVVPIPTRHEYSNRIKKFLWSGAEELSENVERNRAEFAAEGWDWHSVLEDDDMYVDAQSGELVHPVWLEEEENDDAMMLDDLEDENPPTLSRSPSFAINLQELSE